MPADFIRILLSRLAVPAAVLVAGLIFASQAHKAPEEVLQTLQWLPAITGLLALLLSVLFNQRLALLCTLGLGAGLILLEAAQNLAATQPLLAALLYAAYCLFFPANLLILSLLPDRGLVKMLTVLGGLIVAEAALVAWMATGDQRGLTAWLSVKIVDSPLLDTQIPQLGLLLFGLAGLSLLLRYLFMATAMSGALLLAVLPFALAAHWINTPMGVEMGLSLAGLLLVAALLMEAHGTGFRDDLTGIANRRALNLRLRGLGRRYTIAMLDVDHFKKFNDTYGHDTGDDVLKMVASRIARVGGGGRAYRYGGEEFTVLFPGKEVEEVVPHLEALRESIASYSLIIRDQQRPKDHKEGRKLRGNSSSRRSVTVTISIGAAQPAHNRRLPEEVIKAADEALYAAKRGGRNRVATAK